MPTPLLLDPGNWNSTVVAPYTLGAFYETGGKTYQYVQLTDAVNATNGMVAEAASVTAHTVTVDRAGGSSLGRLPVGVFVGSVTAGNYCFLQTAGIHSAVKDTAGNLSAVGNRVMPHATTDGDASSASATSLYIGYALSVSAAGIVACRLTGGG